MPPEQYYAGDCAVTPYIITNNASMARAIQSLLVDIKVCSADRKAIQEWRDSLR